MLDLTPPRHASTLPNAALPTNAHTGTKRQILTASPTGGCQMAARVAAIVAEHADRHVGVAALAALGA
jgi:hypothetical protein